ncbi:hypothetical protein [Marivirga arenosa]|uniref:Uncharacterized protein n=1 Tax=Marivirga arenosa TaxID=3059076 RepID=A0AA51ZWN5_9BACT|nr:hypothetical protein [Marivirga sp. BKB1-2]WNB18165.1 hypothetical protein QYS47_29390 [Marivirga sp. BKB1-2]
MMNVSLKMKSAPFVLLVISVVSCSKFSREIKEIDYSSPYPLSSTLEDKLEQDTLAWRYQISADDFARNGDYRNAIDKWDSARHSRKTDVSKAEIDSINNRYSVKNAKEYILEKAKENQIVIINEAHHNSRHRVFTKSLLSDLYKLGYRNLGLEALNNGKALDSALNERGFPIQESGYYVQDPQFGNMVRTALELGFNVFAYENFKGGGQIDREKGQANNIAQVIKNKPNEKFLIHCGFAHALEGPYPHWGKAMAQRVKDITGIDPYTINQTAYNEKSHPDLNPPILKAIDINESSVLIDQNNEAIKYQRGQAYTDLVILHPTTEFINNRPEWLFDNGNQQVNIQLDEIELEPPFMILAYKEGEDIHKGIPMDISEVKKGRSSAMLALPKGEYTMIVTDEIKSFKFNHKVK